MTQQLLLDPQIYTWVILPMIVISYCVTLIQTYAHKFIITPPAPDAEKMRESQVLLRGRALITNGRYLPRKSFYARKQFFQEKDTGAYQAIVAKHKDDGPANPMQDPSQMGGMMKMQVLNMVPMMGLPLFLNWVFSGFVSIKVPFPLTIAFKQMLQRGVELTTLSSSWVTSGSFYFICGTGIRSITNLFLGSAAGTMDDQMAMMAPQMAMAQQQAPPDPAKTFQGEWEALEIVNHEWALNTARTGRASGASAAATSELAKDELSVVERDLIMAVNKRTL